MSATTAAPIADRLALPLEVAAPDVSGPLAVFPLFGPPPRLAYLPFATAVARGCTIRELEGRAQVNDLTVVNPGDEAVLLYDGEQVVGAQQDRTFDVSVLVAPRTALRVPVSCVENGRWDHRRHGEAFTPSPQASYPALRRMKAEHGRAAAAAGRVARAEQGEVWREVAEKHQRMGTASPSGAMRDIYGGHRERLDALREAIRPRPGQVGMLAAIGDRFVVLDHASRPGAFATLAAPLVRGYALDAIEYRSTGPVATPSLDAARAFVARVCAAPITVRPGVGLGMEARFAGDGVAGTALVHEREVVQVTAFAEDNGPGPRTRVRRPSRRR